MPNHATLAVESSQSAALSPAQPLPGVQSPSNVGVAPTLQELTQLQDHSSSLVEPLRAGASSLKEIVAYCQTLYYCKPEPSAEGSMVGVSAAPEDSQNKPASGKSKTGKGISGAKGSPAAVGAVSAGLWVPPSACPSELADVLNYGASYNQTREYAIQALSSVAYQVGEAARTIQELVGHLDSKVATDLTSRVSNEADTFRAYNRSLGIAALASLATPLGTANHSTTPPGPLSSYLGATSEHVNAPETITRPTGLTRLFPGSDPDLGDPTLELDPGQPSISTTAASSRLTRSTLAGSTASIRGTTTLPPPPTAPKLPSTLQAAASVTSVRARPAGPAGPTPGAISSPSANDLPAIPSPLGRAPVRLGSADQTPSVFGGAPATSAGLFKRGSAGGDVGRTPSVRSTGTMQGAPEDGTTRPPSDIKLGRMGTISSNHSASPTPASAFSAQGGPATGEGGFILGRLVRPATGSLQNPSSVPTHQGSADSISPTTSVASLGTEGSGLIRGASVSRMGTQKGASASKTRPAVRPPPPPPQPVESQPASPLATVLYAFRPETDAELRVEPGWVVRVAGDDVGEGWCEVEVVGVGDGEGEDEGGTVIGRRGLVPAGYVRIEGQ
ncbi:hypothetical protein M427DRAFT_71799 [Gonapodya prolifera JEL478]|uniref:SH3 domain-containing protein n=1 Tax=Gonapodya prolifera (strain JEL478) TaxID=1344416 RepID=A0A139A900_GONPJ|nr:hypothetical protein M427DRAFT_71799 [Gonapodya prolifera JEL478]|eukprot:KXS12873.1 hypothetical protein M427DRAFT_71799 [Gonapodya prolifera JEL478]